MKRQTAITINLNRINSAVDGEQRMTSMEIAELTGKQHNDILKAIRKMEPAWEKVTHIALFLADENRMPLHRHEVQRRGARTFSNKVAAAGGESSRGYGVGTLEGALGTAPSTGAAG